VDGRPPAVTRNLRAFRVLVRNALFRRVELAALRRYDLLGELDGPGAGGDGVLAAAGGPVFDADGWQTALEAYYDEHPEIGTGPDARGPKMLLLDDDGPVWRARQILDDPAGDHDWGISAEIDLAASDEAGVAAVRITAVDRL
jgi:hypothetical protein